MTRRGRRWTGALTAAAVPVVAVLPAACGGDDDDSAATVPATEVTVQELVETPESFDRQTITATGVVQREIDDPPGALVLRTGDMLVVAPMKPDDVPVGSSVTVEGTFHRFDYQDPGAVDLEEVGEPLADFDEEYAIFATSLDVGGVTAEGPPSPDPDTVTADAGPAVVVVDGVATLVQPPRPDPDSPVDITPLEPARWGTDGILLPISEGLVNVDPVAGEVQLDGGVGFTGPAGTVVADDWVVEVPPGEVDARVGGELITPFVRMDVERAFVNEDAEFVVVDMGEARLTAAAADAVSRGTGSPVPAGTTIGELVVRGVTEAGG